MAILLLIIGLIFGYLNGVFLIEPMYDFPFTLQKFTVWINGFGILAAKTLAQTLTSDLNPATAEMQDYMKRADLFESILKTTLAAYWAVILTAATLMRGNIIKLLIVIGILNSIGYYITQYVG